MLCPIKVNNNTMHISCYCVLDLICVIFTNFADQGGVSFVSTGDFCADSNTPKMKQHAEEFIMPKERGKFKESQKISKKEIYACGKIIISKYIATYISEENKHCEISNNQDLGVKVETE